MNMYDNYTPWLKAPKQDFELFPSRYEIWKAGKLVRDGFTSSVITAKVIVQNGSEKVEITFNDNELNEEIAEINIFDEFITGVDRLQLITIPAETDVESMAIRMFNMTIGPTRERKNFTRNEPYVCNLFTKNNIVAKATFAFCNPEKLIEFYP